MQIAAAVVSASIESNGKRGWTSFTLLVRAAAAWAALSPATCLGG
jgi:hypothetical protein